MTQAEGDHTLPCPVPPLTKNAHSLGKIIKPQLAGLVEEQKFVQGSHLPPDSPDISVNMHMGTSGHQRSPQVSFRTRPMLEIPLFSRSRRGDTAQKDLNDSSQHNWSRVKQRKLGEDHVEPEPDPCDVASSSSFSSSTGSSLEHSIDGGQASINRKFNLFR